MIFPVHAHKQRILIIDDNPTNLGVLAGYLKTYNFQIITARSGQKGIENALMTHPDLILLDVMMPDIDGFETCRRLKADQHTREIPVIFITALQNVENKVKGFASGGVDYLTKPFQEEEVLARIRTHLQLQAQKQQIQQYAQELEQAKELAEAAQKIAEKANHAKSTFLANMSHELRSPLNAILGFAQVMSRSETLPPEHREHLAIIRRSGDHLLMVINQILDLSKIEAGHITPDVEEVDVHHLLDEVYDLFRLRAEQKGLRFGFSRSPGTPRRIYTDAVKLRQVLINLLNNALKFTQQGSVTLRVAPEKNGEAGGRVSLHFDIEDTGPGIAPEELAQVFEPFVQTAAGRQAHEGTGLGLPISQKFVQLLGGDITVKSEMGVGTLFAFTMTCEVSAADETRVETAARRVAALAPGQPAYRLLLVDDSPENRQVLAALLHPVGFDLREAADGQEAFDLWRNWQPQIILMEMRLPVMDGYETAKRIRAEEERQPPARRCGIIALTASAFKEERAAVLAAGCDEFVRKPFKEEEIFALLQQYLGLQYLYAEEVNGSQSPDAKPFVLNAAAFADLPAHLLEGLFEAANHADMELAQAMIDRIRPQNAPLADALAKFVGEYRFDVLLKVVQQALERKNGTI